MIGPTAAIVALHSALKHGIGSGVVSAIVVLALLGVAIFIGVQMMRGKI